MNKPAPPTPMCDKLSSVRDERNAIVNFLEWLQERGIELASYHKHTDMCRDHQCEIVCGMSEQVLYSVNTRRETLAHQYLEIDEKVLEQERQALLEHISQ